MKVGFRNERAERLVRNWTLGEEIPGAYLKTMIQVAR